jgi:alkylation response protein AidB-like acyl-CoA dehydrogenase
MSNHEIRTIEQSHAAVLALGPMIAKRAGEIEAGRRIPGDLLEDLVRAGAFRVLVPEAHRGLEGDLSDAMVLFETLARFDASVAWSVMIGGSACCDLVALPRESFDWLFDAGPDVIFAGGISPSGSVVPVDGGYEVTGRWGFISGGEHANWIWGNCLEATPDGEPAFRIAVFEPEQVVIEDTWDVVGLAGTGSHHIRVDRARVPAEMTVALFVDQPSIDVVIARVPTPSLIALSIAAVAAGVAQGALDDVVALAIDKTPLLAEGTLASDPNFQSELAKSDAEVHAARLLLHELAGSLWATVAEGSEPSLELRARIRAAAVWATDRAAEVVGAAYRAGGGSSIYSSSSLQRRLRDVNAITQHFLVRPSTLTTAGAALAGREVTVPVF